MKTVLLLLSIVYTSAAYTTERNPGPNLCEIDIQPGFFENKLVPGGTYIYDTTEFDTAEECMQSCCDQSLNSYNNQMLCNMAYFYQEPDPYNPGQLRNVCVWWNCKPGACQPRRDIDPQSTSRVGFILPQQQQDSTKDQTPYGSQYPDNRPSYQYQTGYAYSQPADSIYQSGNQNDPAISIPNNQLETAEAVPSNIYNQPVPSSRPILQNQGLPLSNDVLQESVNSPPTGNSDNGEGNWVYDPSTGQYVLAYPPSPQAPVPVRPNTPISYEPDNLTAAAEEQLNDTLHKDELNETVTDEPYYTTTVDEVEYTPTEAQGWFWGKWWSNDDDDEEGEEIDDEDFEDDEDWNSDEWPEEKNDTGSWYDDQYATENAEWEKEEEEWEKEEEEEEEEWEEELEEWEKEEEEAAEEEGTTRSAYYTTTMTAEELARLEEEELEEEKELEEWLENYEETEDGQKSKEEDNQQQPIVQSEDNEFYKPETYAQSPQSDWSVNAPVIVIGACAGVVLIALIFILVGKKLTGKTDRAQYKPLRESFSGSSTYHEDI